MPGIVVGYEGLEREGGTFTRSERQSRGRCLNGLRHGLGFFECYLWSELVMVSSEVCPGSEPSCGRKATVALGKGPTWGQGSLLCSYWEIYKV